MIKELLNIDKYISQDILKQCFETGRHNFVDKVVCGNGFSTAFLRMPVKSGKYNIIICPNKGVIRSKREAYLTGEIETPNTITFHFKEGTDTINNPGNIMMFVIDSFIKQLDAISNLIAQGCIDKILIDEAHTVEQSSIYRPLLRVFHSKLDPLIPNCAIVSVTATPNFYSKVDIRINNVHLKPVTINITGNRTNSIKRALEDLKMGKNVYIATNDWRVVYALKHPKKRVIEANFIVGDSLLRNLVDKAILKYNPESNLVIGSSSSFEGMDLNGCGWSVYYFEDRSRDVETFFISNLYQAISRPRKGVEYAEYCRNDCNTMRDEEITNESVDKFIDHKRISTEKKMGYEYRKFHPFVIFNPKGKGLFSIKKDEVAIKLLDESRLFDAGFASFQNFLDVRKISVNNLNEAPERMKFPKVKEQIKIKNLLTNKSIIKKRDLFGNTYKVDSKGCVKEDDFIRAVKKYFRNKNYDGNYSFLPRQTKGLELLRDSDAINRLAKKLISNYNQKHKNDSNKNGKREKDKKEFAQTIHNRIRKLVVLLVNTRIREYYTVTGNRQYSNIVGCPSTLVQEICDMMGINFTRVDISMAFSRVIYALNGLHLPNEFYGENKKNKKRINILLNNFFYNPNQLSEKKHQKENAKRKFKELGFNPEVINWLMENYFDCEYRGDLFNFYAWHEKQIIEQVRGSVMMELNEGCIRKHDELMLFNNKQDLLFLNDFEYLGVKGWFNMELPEEVETPESLEKFFKDVAQFKYMISQKKGSTFSLKNTLQEVVKFSKNT